MALDIKIRPSDRNETASDGHFLEGFGDRHLPSRYGHLSNASHIDDGAIKLETSGKGQRERKEEHYNVLCLGLKFGVLF